MRWSRSVCCDDVDQYEVWMYELFMWHCFNDLFIRNFVKVIYKQIELQFFRNYYIDSNSTLIERTVKNLTSITTW